MVRPTLYLRWLSVVAAVAAVGLAMADGTLERLMPFGVTMNPGDGSAEVDPRNPVTVEAVGFGARLAEVRIHDGGGKLLAEAKDRAGVTLPGPLDFGQRYRVAATVERLWTGQRASYEMTLTTVAKPALMGSLDRTLDPDGSVTLSFDRPVGPVAASGPLAVKIEMDAAKQVVRLLPENYAQGQTLPLQLDWSTTTGVPLPPLQLSIATPPPLSAEVTPNAVGNLGLAMPIQVAFSEPLANRDDVGKHFTVRTKEGSEVAGKWSWINKSRLHFYPQPAWPASSTIELTMDQKGLRSARGGVIEKPTTTQFSTGTDRRIYVYLDSQRMSAVENGEVVKTFRVSTGKAKTPTVAGSFYIYARFPIKTMKSRAKPGQPGHYVVENVPYAQYFHADYAFHGAWWHNGFGRPASHGCVNMSTRNHNKRWPGVPEDAGWLYRWASLGVPVTVLRSTPSQQVAMQ